MKHTWTVEMAFFRSLTFFFLLVGLSSCLKCRIKAVEDGGGVVDPDSEMCAYKKFEGPVGDIIATAKPTKLSKYALSHSKQMVGNMASFVSLLPVVGGYVSFALNQFSKFGLEGTGGVINRILGEIEGQLNSLKNYIDKKVQHLEHTQLTQLLRGMLTAAASCADYDKKSQIKNLETCLISLNTRVTGSVGRFLPDNDNIIAFDWILPLFRQYADFQLTITQDLLRVAIYLNKTADQEDYVKRLQDQATEFRNFSVSAVDRIVKVHTRFGGRSCHSENKWHEEWYNIFSLQIGYSGTCSKVLYRDRLCKEVLVILMKDAVNPPDARQKAVDKALACVNDYAATVKTNLEKDLRKYWKIEITDIADEWKKIAEKAAKIPTTKKNRKKNN